MPDNAARNHLSSPATSLQARSYVWAIGIILVTTLPWWIATTCPFIYLDDSAYISANPHILNGLSLHSLGWAFTTTATGFWFPLTWISLMTDASVFGPGAFGFHFTNVLLHILNAVLVYIVLRRMTSKHLRSLLVALLFAMHPLRVESVAWATERKDVFTAFFGLLTLWTYIEYARRRSVWRYALILIFYTLALLSKSMLVTLPLLFLLLDFWPLQRTGSADPLKSLRPLLLEKLPLILMALAVCAITYSVQLRTNANVYEAVKPLALRSENAALSYVLYLRDVFVFNDLSIYYNYDDHISVAGAGSCHDDDCHHRSSSSFRLEK